MQILINIHSVDKRFIELGNVAHQQSRQKLILVPLYNEGELSLRYINNFISIFSKIEKVKLVFITHYSDIETTEIIQHELARLGDNNFIHHLNKRETTSKADQLSDALEELNPNPDTIISVYDCDSLPDHRAINQIENLISLYPDLNNAVFQQSPFYPLLKQIHNPLKALAQSRAIHSLNYHFTSELTTYIKSEQHQSLRMAIHLTGHGEHLTFSLLEKGGGFIPPSCDSSLGFNLSYQDIPFIFIPIPDSSSTPGSITEIYRQGLRWYNGCDLYLREFTKNIITTQNYVKCFLTFINNLRWFLLPVLFIIASIYTLLGDNHIFYVEACAGFSLLYIRHISLFLAYYLLLNNSKIKNPEIYKPSFITWMGPYFIFYLLIRLVWSIPPWHYYLNRLLGNTIEITSTLKEEVIEL